VNFIRHKDWLGSSRLATTWAHAVFSKEAYAPFGETYNEAGTPDRSFTGQDQNVATGPGGTGAYDFLFRKYDPSAGRWLSPDPAGWSAVDQTTPQSLNRYAYVENQPMSFTDPTGLTPIPCPENVSSDDGGSDADIVIVACDNGTPSDNTYIPGPVQGQDLQLIPNEAPSTSTISNLLSKAVSCHASAFKKEGVALATDAIGIIPGEGNALRIVQLAAGAVGFVNGLVQKDPAGSVGSVLTAQAVGVGWAAQSVGATALEAVPAIGNAASGVFAVRDLIHEAQDAYGCLEGN
jgi:RHS repeat-associated protein